MGDTGSNTKKYILLLAVGAIGGGIAIALATRAMPKMMSGMMQSMMARMGEDGCDPHGM
jgi:hypothetical protein